MTIIFSIIAIVALVSLYDYFSARNWQQVTSSVRNDVVFEKRNKAYGAYMIRKDYNKRMILIMVGMIGSIGAGYGAFLVTRSVPVIAEKETGKEVELTTIELDLTKKEIILPELPKATAPSIQKLAEFTAPVVTDVDILKGQKVIEDDQAVGGKEQEGETGFGPDIIADVIDTNTNIKPPVYTSIPLVDVDEPAQYIGGKEKMIEFLSKNLVFPETAYESGGGKCYLRFVVDKEGQISNIKVTRGLDDCPECEQEAVRAIRKMPKWRPGKVNGKAVDSYFDMPINFVVKNY